MEIVAFSLLIMEGPIIFTLVHTYILLSIGKTSFKELIVATQQISANVIESPASQGPVKNFSIKSYPDFILARFSALRVFSPSYSTGT